MRTLEWIEDEISMLDGYIDGYKVKVKEHEKQICEWSVMIKQHEKDVQQLNKDKKMLGFVS